MLLETVHVAAAPDPPPPPSNRTVGTCVVGNANPLLALVPVPDEKKFAPLS